VLKIGSTAALAPASSVALGAASDLRSPSVIPTLASASVGMIDQVPSTVSSRVPPYSGSAR